MTMDKPGKLITVEGIEGVGKSSNVQFIANLLRLSGKKAIVTREPGGTPLAEEIRKLLLTEFEELTLAPTELLLLYAGRLQHVENVIKPALKKGKWVVCDRFTDATFAYQGGGRELPLDKIESLNHWTLGNFVPDYTILLDAPVEVALARIQQDRRLDRFEKETQAFFERVRQVYLNRAKQAPSRYAVIDASVPLPSVQNALKQFLENMVTEKEV